MRPPSKIDFVEHYKHQFGARHGQGTIVDLLDILDDAIRTGWTNERTLQYFGSQTTAESQEELENNCHFYASSKGRIIAEGHNLRKCKMFPGVKLSTDFLDQYIHTLDDFATYGDYVTRVVSHLRKRAQRLEEME